jgi:hypothetical protein
MKPFTRGGWWRLWKRCQTAGGGRTRFFEPPARQRHHLIPMVYMKVFTRDATVRAARRFCIVFCEVCPFKLSVKMSAEAETSNFDTERFRVEVHSRIALWDMSTEAYSNRYLKKKSWEELVEIFMNKEEAAAAEKNEYGRLHF